MSVWPLVVIYFNNQVKELLLNPLLVVQQRLMVKERVTNVPRELSCLQKLLHKLGKRSKKHQNAAFRGLAASVVRVFIESCIGVSPSSSPSSSSPSS